MKEIRGSASTIVRKPARDCFSLLAAVDRYGVWNEDLIRELEVLERGPDQLPTRVRAVIAVKRMRTFELTVEVSTDAPHAVYLTRIPNEPSDREALDLVWRIDPSSGKRTNIELRFVALASFVPGFMPLGGVGDAVAQRLLDSAVSALGGEAA